MDDSRVELMMRLFPTRGEYAGLLVSAIAAVLGVASGDPPSAVTLAVFAYFAVACLFGGAVEKEGGRRGFRIARIGWIENDVRKDGGGDD